MAVDMWVLIEERAFIVPLAEPRFISTYLAHNGEFDGR